jgi:hypothetical protein
MPRKSESGQVRVPASSPPTRGKGAAAKSQPRVQGNGRTRGTSDGVDLKKALRDFAAARPDGWNHDDWIHFLEDLKARGHNINDRDAVGRMLERERLGVLLEKVPGMGPQRIQKLADKFGTVWRLRDASTDEIADAANLPRALAEKVREAVAG